MIKGKPDTKGTPIGVVRDERAFLPAASLVSEKIPQNRESRPRFIRPGRIATNQRHSYNARLHSAEPTVDDRDVDMSGREPCREPRAHRNQGHALDPSTCL